MDVSARGNSCFDRNNFGASAPWSFAGRPWLRAHRGQSLSHFDFGRQRHCPLAGGSFHQKAACPTAAPRERLGGDVVGRGLLGRLPVIKPAEKLTTSSSRPGHATLEIQFVAGQSAVVSARSANPLKLLAPRARGESVWAFTSSFGGGLVAGDQTQLDLQVGAGSRCFLGTQASTKVYRNPRLQPCGHVTHARIGTDGLLVFAPEPVQPFADSSYVQRQDFRLAAGASLVFVDWFTAGRTARGEEWQFRRLQTRNSVYLEKGGGDGFRDELAFIDSVLLRPDDGPIGGQHRVGRYRCFALVLFLGPKVASMAEVIQGEVAGQAVGHEAPLLAGASPVRDGVVLRLAGTEVESVTREIRRHLAPLRALLGDDPWSRKW